MKTSKELIEQLAVIDENILAEAATQPAKFVDAARYRVQAMRGRMQAMAQYETWKSRLGLHYRRSKTQDDKRVTEGEIKDRIQVHAKTQIYDDRLQKAFAREEFAKLLLEAYRMRRDGIRIIHEGQLAEGKSGASELERAELRRKLRQKARELEHERKQVEDDE